MSQMRPASLFGALLLAVASMACGAGERLTDRCVILPTAPEVGLTVSSAFLENFKAVMAAPYKNPDFYDRLWNPLRWSASAFSIDDKHFLRLSYADPLQDPVQIAEEMNRDGGLRMQGMYGAYADGYGCFAVPYPHPEVLVTEYHNVILDHYFLVSTREEMQSIDSGAAGPGWVQTGESFSAYIASWCSGGYEVRRFYGPSAKSHVFTSDAQECGILRKPDTGWIYEGVAFGVGRPRDGSCPDGAKTVWRLYNNRAVYEDPNHRYVTRKSLIDEMTQRGWMLEGVAFCVRP